MGGLLEPGGGSLRVESTRIVARWAAGPSCASFIPRPLPQHSAGASHAPASGGAAPQGAAGADASSARAAQRDAELRESAPEELRMTSKSNTEKIELSGPNNVTEQTQSSSAVQSGESAVGDCTRPAPAAAAQCADPCSGAFRGGLGAAGRSGTPSSGEDAVPAAPAALALSAVPGRVRSSRRPPAAGAGVVDGAGVVVGEQANQAALCKFFVNTGSCPRGGLCPYEHAAPEVAAAARKLWLSNR